MYAFVIPVMDEGASELIEKSIRVLSLVQICHLLANLVWFCNSIKSTSMFEHGCSVLLLFCSTWALNHDNLHRTFHLVSLSSSNFVFKPHKALEDWDWYFHFHSCQSETVFGQILFDVHFDFCILVDVPPAHIEGAVFMTYTAASHQGGIQMF